MSGGETFRMVEFAFFVALLFTLLFVAIIAIYAATAR